jgi:hypothetical protein
MNFNCGSGAASQKGVAAPDRAPDFNYIFVYIFLLYELLSLSNPTSSVTFLIHVGWLPDFVGVKPQAYVPTYQGYVPWDGLEDGQSRDRLSILHKP